MGREFELKYRAEEKTLAAIREKYGPFSSTEMETTYYDTPDLKLSVHQWTLRQRRENGVAVCTFKKPLDDGSKAEWEVQNESLMMGILELVKAGAPAELMRCTAGGLIPLCGARFTRLAATLEVPGGTVELALDRGKVTGRKGEAPICEVEVELKSGPDAAALAFAQLLVQEFGLEKEPLSKFARARALSL